MKMDENAPPFSVIQARMDYDAQTGVFTAKVSAGRRRAGDVLGYADSLGYIKVAVNGKWILAHRLAWRFVHGAWPTEEIDHINGNPSDNRIVNLRQATRSQNVMNTRRGNGVCWRPKRRKWQVIVRANRRQHYIGSFSSRTDADEAAAAAIRRLHGEFANVAAHTPDMFSEAAE